MIWKDCNPNVSESTEKFWRNIKWTFVRDRLKKFEAKPLIEKQLFCPNSRIPEFARIFIKHACYGHILQSKRGPGDNFLICGEINPRIRAPRHILWLLTIKSIVKAIKNASEKQCRKCMDKLCKMAPKMELKSVFLAAVSAASFWHRCCAAVVAGFGLFQ